MHASSVLKWRLAIRLRRPAFGPARGATLAIALLTLLAACSTPASEPVAPKSADPEADAAKARGEAIVVGKAPAASGGLASILILEPKDPREFPAPAAPPVMDQISQVFTPGVLFVQTGQPAEFRNSDEILHNIRVRNDETKEAAFNIALPTGGTYAYTFHKEGFYDVGCDIHPAMAAVIIASKSPYTALAEQDGRFVIGKPVPAGTYTLTVFADVRRIDRTVEIAAGRTDLGEIALPESK